jgi:hypothetical protein
MKNWVPKRLLTRTLEESERLTIVERSIDLVNNDPHAAGVADGFASTIVGSGLTPHPTLNPIALPGRDWSRADWRHTHLCGLMSSVFPL